MGSKSTTQSEAKPPEWTLPGYKLAGSEIDKAYASGLGGRAYEGPTLAPQSGATQAGINQLYNAGQNWDTSGTRNLFGGIGASAVSGPQITTGNQYSKIYNEAQAPTSSGANLADMASGKWLESGNPYFNERLEGQLADTAAQVRSLSSGMGRYGSDVSTRMLTDRLGGIRSEALGQDWDRNLNAQLAANQQIDSANSQRLGNQLNAVAGLTGTQAQNIANRFQGLGMAQNAATSMAGLDQQNFQNRLSGAQAAMGAGSAIDSYNQNILADREALWREIDNEPWNRIGLLTNALSGASANYGTQTSRTKSSNPGAVLGAMMGGK